MAATTKVQICVVALMVMMVASAQLAQGALTCGQVVSAVGPCVNHVMGKGPLTPACCNGIKSISAAAASTPDRQQVCRCLKPLAGTKGVNLGLAAGVPGKCGVKVPFPISASVNCNTVKY